MSDTTFLQLIRFCIVGVANTLFSYLIYCIFLYFGFTFQMASFLAIVIGIFFSFSMQGKFVFFNANKWLIWKFILSWVIIYILQISYINFAINEFGYNAYIIGLTSLPISVILSYLLQKFFVFRA